MDSGRPVSRQSLQSGDLGGSRRGRQMSITLDKFTGDSLLHFSYSAVGGGAGGMLSESALGNIIVLIVVCLPFQYMPLACTKFLQQVCAVIVVQL